MTAFARRNLNISRYLKGSVHNGSEIVVFGNSTQYIKFMFYHKANSNRLNVALNFVIILYATDRLSHRYQITVQKYYFALVRKGTEPLIFF